MEQLHTIISTYVETVNQFFSGKLLDLNVQSGIVIRSKWSGSINPNFLSSGERQLLLLLSNTILARWMATIFIIDEPELSLNIKWQRQLVEALLRCSFGGGVQYILACLLMSTEAA
jgi:predicted ATPase